MTLYSTVGFAAAMLVLAASPGPGVFATVARALSSGFRAAAGVVFGIVLGDLIFLMFAAFGLSMVATALGEFFVVVKWCGGAYLIWLGIKIWRSAWTMPAVDSARRHPNRWGNSVSGLLITLSNPKVILFYGGFLPTFLDLSALTPADLGVVMAVVTAVLSGVLLSYAFMASRARRLFARKEAAVRLNRAAGGVMVAAGVAMAVKS